MEVNKIIRGDCIKVMKGMPDNSVDLIVTDPPYNISKKNNFATMKRYNQYEGMDFGEWDKGFNQLSWLPLAIKKLKVPASMIIFNSWQNLKVISDELEFYNLSTKRILVIRKTNPMPVNRDRLFTNSFEFALWATKGSKWTFNREGKYETGYFECRNNGVTKHPTEKNIDVIKNLIKILSKKDDIILDPFLGSGTTAVACKELGRKYIGIEISPEYYEIARRRISAIPELLF